jgi:transposase
VRLRRDPTSLIKQGQELAMGKTIDSASAFQAADAEAVRLLDAGWRESPAPCATRPPSTTSSRPAFERGCAEVGVVGDQARGE